MIGPGDIYEQALHPEVCPNCGKDGYEVMLCFSCDHCPEHCKCDELAPRFVPAQPEQEGGNDQSISPSHL